MHNYSPKECRSPIASYSLDIGQIFAQCPVKSWKWCIKFYKKIFLNHLLSLIHTTWVWFCQFCTVDIRAHYCTMVSIFVHYEWLHHLRRPAWPGATYNRVRLEMEPRSWVTISSQSSTAHQTFSSYFGGHFLGLFLYFHANKISDICVDVMIYIFFFLH